VCERCPRPITDRLWVYTNYDCNLSCSYCCVSSSPRAERAAFSLSAHRQLIDEAAAAGVQQLFLTGGEPFLLPDIQDRIRCAVDRLPTTVLTNAMLFRGSRLSALEGLAGAPLTFQVSLDGPCPEAHDPIRGAGSWSNAVAGIRTLRALGFRVVLSSTESDANRSYLGSMPAFVECLGLAPEDHFVRPLARRGVSCDGLDLGPTALEPEVTVSRDGVYWHPLGREGDLLVTRRVFPLAAALAEVERRHHILIKSGELPRPFR
jgi:MoaA/NifB/PqqE/SkfB family radical SAM enzyme